MALSDDRIVGIVSGRIARSVGFMDSTISAERQRVLEYYEGKLPRPIHKGNSKYVSRDVFDSVEMMTAQLLETFTGTIEPVYFLPQNGSDVREAKIATTLVNTVVDQMNDGFSVKQAVIKDGLMGRIGVAKVWWEKNEEEEELQFEAEDGADSDDALYAFMAQNPDADVTDAEQHPATGLIKSATFSKKTDSSQVRIMEIPGEEFGVSGGARTVDDADLVYHRKEMTHAELTALYPDKVDEIGDMQMGTQWITDAEKSTRTNGADENAFGSEADEQQAGRRVEVYECYTKLDVDETDGKTSKSDRKLWQVVIAGGRVLAKEQVKRQPFKVFIPLPMQHTMWGTNYGSILIATQNARTALTRGIIDHTVITTNPRWTVLRGGLPTPTELTESKIGGIVNTTKPDAIGVLPQPNLNPFVFQTRQILDEDKEELTGISKLSQGLNKDALSKQNSGDMVEQLVSMSQVRQKVIARRFAECFMKPLYLEVYQLILENATKEFILSVAGDWVQVDPSALRVRKELKVDFALGYGEKASEAKKWTQVFAALTQAAQTDPAIAQAFGSEQKWLVISRALEAQGIKDVTAILPDPKTLPPPPPNPGQQLQMQKAQADIAMQQAQASATTAKIQREEQRDQMAHQLEMMKLQIEIQKLQDNTALAVRKQNHLEALDAAVLQQAQEEIDAGNAQGVVTAKT